jgi:hypothetical protein
LSNDQQLIYPQLEREFAAQFESLAIPAGFPDS